MLELKLQWFTCDCFRKFHSNDNKIANSSFIYKMWKLSAQLHVPKIFAQQLQRDVENDNTFLVELISVCELSYLWWFFFRDIFCNVLRTVYVWANLSLRGQGVSISLTHITFYWPINGHVPARDTASPSWEIGVRIVVVVYRLLALFRNLRNWPPMVNFNFISVGFLIICLSILSEQSP